MQHLDRHARAVARVDRFAEIDHAHATGTEFAPQRPRADARADPVRRRLAQRAQLRQQRFGRRLRQLRVGVEQGREPGRERRVARGEIGQERGALVRRQVDRLDEQLAQPRERVVAVARGHDVPSLSASHARAKRQ